MLAWLLLVTAGACEAVAEQKAADNEHRDDRELGGGQPGLQPAAGARPPVVDRRQHHDDPDGENSRVRRHDVTQQIRGVAREHRRNRRNDPRVHRPEHRPAPQKSRERRERIPQEDVEAAGLWKC